MDMIRHVITGECKQKGEDCSATFQNKVAGLRGTILADGLGSRSKARETAELIVFEMQTKLEQLENVEKLDLQLLFSDVHDSLLNSIQGSEEGGTSIEGNSHEYGATLIVTIEADDKFIVAYVGNGAVWHFRGNVFKKQGNRILPWSMANLLNPHTLPEDGMEALYKYFSGSLNKGMVSPTILEISKDTIYGDILFSCTDGISSNDQLSIGKVPSGVWASVDDALVLFLDHLARYLDSDRSQNALVQCRDEYVTALGEAPFVDDDASFGLVLCLPNLS